MKLNAAIAVCILSFVAYGQCEKVQNNSFKHAPALTVTDHDYQQRVPTGVPSVTDPNQLPDGQYQPSGQVKHTASAHDASGIPPPPKPTNDGSAKPTNDGSAKPSEVPSRQPLDDDDKKDPSKREVTDDASGIPPRPTKSTGKPPRKSHSNGKKKAHHKRGSAHNAGNVPPPPKPTGKPQRKSHGDGKKKAHVTGEAAHGDKQ